ncbi:MAG TPA: class II glutamine amidotransferase [Solirubrobacteraceae bacterium]|nr:class II glutamine amidotransferase [Solirubrobacteraceae bacterium]
MCRLFGMSAGPERVQATFWLLEAPNSLAQQSHREPDGTGLGTYDPDGRPIVSKQPLAAYEDQEFARAARSVASKTFVAHVRYASTGSLTPQNTHPFQQRDRLFAHNGVIEELGRLERELGDAMKLVEGDTDSERFFALITREIERRGDVSDAIAAACCWVAENLPLLALNLVLISDSDLWALRYPDTHELHVLERSAGGPDGSRRLDHSTARRRIKVRSDDLATSPAVVIASEPMDDDPGWRPVASGELLHVDGDLAVSSRRVLGAPPARLLTLADLDPRARSSQQPQTYAKT